MKKIATVLLLIFNLTLSAQTKKYIDLELAGSNGLMGVSYDSRFNDNPKFGYKIRFGYGFELHNGSQHLSFSPIRAYFPKDERVNNSVTLPFNAYYLIGKENNFLETGLGICAFYADYYNKNDKGLGYFTFGRLAYRHESVNNKLAFSIGLDVPFYTPGSGLMYSVGLAPSISIGYRIF